MLDRRIFRDNPEAVRENFRRRNKPDRVADVDKMVALDEETRGLGTRVDELRHRVKQASAEIGRVMKAGADAAGLKEDVRRVSEELAGCELRQREVEAERSGLELTFENMLLPQVESGASSDDNVVMRTWGEIPVLGFAPIAHDVLGERLGIMDFARAAKVSGARFTFLVGAGARLEHALIRFMREMHQEAGDVEMLPPLIVTDQTLIGTAQLPKFKADQFQVSGDREMYLIPTSEVPVTNFHADEILEAAELPKRYFAYSPCFRSEAGSYGKDVRGYIRQHHFNKVEMVRIATPEQAPAELEAMTDRAQEVLRRLGLAHRVVRLCGGDTGFASALTYDVEVWLPSQQAYREISSCSTCSDFQARRAKIRYRPAPGAKPETCHTLNGSGLAVGRTVVAILEQCQRPDGTVFIPEALQACFGAAEITRA